MLDIMNELKPTTCFRNTKYKQKYDGIGSCQNIKIITILHLRNSHNLGLSLKSYFYIRSIPVLKL